MDGGPYKRGRPSGPVSFEDTEADVPVGNVTSLRDAGLPMAFGRQKPKAKTARPKGRDAVAAAEAEESARLAALSASFTPFQPKALQALAALGPKEEEKKVEEDAPAEPEVPLTATELRLKQIRERMQKASELNKRVRVVPGPLLRAATLRHCSGLPPPSSCHRFKNYFVFVFEIIYVSVRPRAPPATLLSSRFDCCSNRRLYAAEFHFRSRIQCMLES